MLKVYSWAALLMFMVVTVHAQKISFTEYDLSNGLHVILHQDTTAPVIAVSVMYHVGSKNEDTNRTGFAHFFEHLLFEGSENIKRGEFDKIVSSHGGYNNATTSQDRTFYFETFPSNQLQLALWLESERMMHPVINEEGVETQNEVVKEEKRMRIDNQPYGKFTEEIFKRLFKEHPYRWQTIGSMAHLDSARLSEFLAFFKKYYVPNNAVLTIAGDINIDSAKQLIKAYFEPIPRGNNIAYHKIEEPPLSHEIVDTVYDANIQIPAIFTAYRVPGNNTRDAKTLELISYILSNGASSRLYKKMVDEKKTALQVAAFNYGLEDYGAYITLALPNQNASLDSLLHDIDEEVVRLQTELISDIEYKKLLNQYENNYVNSISRVLGVAENLAEGYIFYHNTNHINEDLKEIQSISKEEIRAAAQKYLNSNQRVVLYYMPPK